MTNTEPRNPLYLLLLLASLLFVVTALAYAIVPVLERKATDAGQPPPPSAFRDTLRKDGWRWLLYEVGAVVVLSIASMAVDRLRTLQKQHGKNTIVPVAREKAARQKNSGESEDSHG
jgi:bacteriorhodopsin